MTAIRRGSARRMGLRHNQYLVPLAAIVLPDGRTLHAVVTVSPALTWRRNGRPRSTEQTARSFVRDARGRAVHDPGVTIGAGMIRTGRPPLAPRPEVSQ